ncbi:hypothetical protein K3722_04155 [Leisingera caerulea]|uniref:Uncharacterized protein n=1 Tax=Leisingera caerulea TaxID=506591 RepID=A0ABY5WYT9_LEICA|nr:hypothetical protein [Leisingera caerulea]UWQ59328.1 hypothetical protein K3722_04155 [Leisingera caerulea]
MKISDFPSECIKIGDLSLVNGVVELRVNEFANQPGVWMLVVDGEIARFTGADTRTMHQSAHWWQRSGNSERHNHFARLLRSALGAGQAVELFGCQPDGGSYVATARVWRKTFSVAWS